MRGIITVRVQERRKGRGKKGAQAPSKYMAIACDNADEHAIIPVLKKAEELYHKMTEGVAPLNYLSSIMVASGRLEAKTQLRVFEIDITKRVAEYIGAEKGLWYEVILIPNEERGIEISLHSVYGALDMQETYAERVPIGAFDPNATVFLPVAPVLWRAQYQVESESEEIGRAHV